MKILKIISSSILAVLFSVSLIAGPAYAQDLNDAEVAHAAVTANMVDLNHAKIAILRANSEAVRSFAQTMYSDHGSVIKKALTLAGKLGVMPQENTVSESLMDRAEDVSEKLKSVSSDKFDWTYMNNEVKYHKAVINAVKNVLIPATENAQLKSLLQKAAPIFQHHMEMAKEIRDKISGDMDM